MKSRESRNTEEVFLIEALGRVCAQDVGASVDRGPLVPKGTLISPLAIGGLAAMGIDRVPVYRKPRISIVIVGQGLLVPPAASRSLGRAYDSNALMLRAALEALKVRPVFVRRVVNKPVLLLKNVIPYALKQSDIVILLIDEYHSQRGWIRSLKEKTDAKTVFHSEDSEITGFEAVGSKKLVFCLPNDSGVILDYFYKNIQPAIRSFMAG